jgi:serralysin
MVSNDTYIFSNTTAPFTKVIWDGGGKDTIDASAQTAAVKINLTAGKFSSIGFGYQSSYSTYSATDNLSIAYGVDMEDAIGGGGWDTLTGNSLDPQRSPHF